MEPPSKTALRDPCYRPSIVTVILVRSSPLRRPFVILLVAPLIAVSSAQTNCSAMSTGIGASLNGFTPFPSTSLWNENIAGAPVDPNSQNYINFIGTSTPLHPDFGSGLYGGQSIGIPYI